MTHVDDGLLRRLADEGEQGFTLGAPDTAHLAGCADCQARLTAATASGQATAALFGDPLPAPDWGPALARLRDYEARPTSSLRLERMPTVIVPNPLRRWLKPLTAVAVVALVAALIVLTPLGSYAQGVLNLFTPKQFVAVPVTASQLRSLPDLSDFGTMTGSQQSSPRIVSSADEAAAAAGVALLKPTSLPQGISSKVTYQVMPGNTASYTFDAARAEASAKARGNTATAMPKNVNGSVLSVTIYPAAIVSYGETQVSLPETAKSTTSAKNGAPQTAGMPNLIIGQAKAPVAQSTGATLAEIQSYILAQPGVAPELAAAIRSIADPTSTLPVPIDVSRMSGRAVKVQGVDGLLLGDSTGLGSAVVWSKDGQVFFVGGPLRDTEVLDVANGLK